MNALEVASFVAAIASLVLSVVAIVLSVVFYRMSSVLSESTKEAARGIGANVEKLEKLFDRLYADTFSMMKETVSDMRRHAWGEEASDSPDILVEAEKRANKKIETLRGEMEGQLSRVLQGQQTTDGRIDKVKTELERLLDRAIRESRRVEHEVREEAIRDTIVSEIKNSETRGEALQAIDLVDALRGKFSVDSILSEIERMKKDRLVTFEGPPIHPDTVIKLA